MSATHLLDANVLIALVVQEHEHHERATRWAAGVERFALCPVVEGALVRYLLRLGESSRTASSVLDAVHALPGCDFWADDLSYRDVGLTELRGHRQVTDAYLVASARARSPARVATMDDGMVETAPDVGVLLPR